MAVWPPPASSEPSCAPTETPSLLPAGSAPARELPVVPSHAAASGVPQKHDRAESRSSTLEAEVSLEPN
jgi:hypothetical protein